MAISTASANAALDAILVSGDYLALFTANPDPSGANEVTGGSYARQALTYGAASGGSKANSTQLEYTMPAATVTHMGIMSAASAGTLKWSAPVTAPKTFSADDICIVRAGGVTASIE